MPKAREVVDVSGRFRELAWQTTPMGELSLRRRYDPVLRDDVYEIKLADEFLMSSAFTAGEVAAAELALARLDARDPDGPWDIAVGGLGLGYTARAALDHPRVGSLLVVEALAEVIEWHDRGLVPATVSGNTDPRCRLVHGDFFALVEAGGGLDPTTPGRRFHAVIVDIDHSPGQLLHTDHAGFYRPAGLRRLAGSLHPGGVFALWSDEPPEDTFRAALADVFTDVAADVVTFPNPLAGGTAANTVYLATTTG